MRKLGADYAGNGKTTFTVWAPEVERMQLHLLKPTDKRLAMTKDEWGYFTIALEGVNPGDLYFFIPDDKKDLPDPASHFQPQGVHGPSAVVNHSAFRWSDASWKGIPFQEVILYELHVGTFSREGTFEGIIPYLDDLAALGVNALELMPIAQFPGNRNWGYDGVYPYAVQDAYGGPEGLKKLVDACHAKGLAVFLDVVYNHLGPEGNYFSQYAPYFTDRYKVPWGDAINFDGAWSDGVREYYSNNPLHWYQHYHIDGIRVDAIHAMYDHGAAHFWQLTREKINRMVEKGGRSFHTIAESDLNNPIVIKPAELNGWAFRAQWLDDFHHAMYVLVHREGKVLYEDFGRMQQLAKGFTDGFVHSGEYVNFRKRKFGASSAGISGDHFVVFTDNHDQAGNRVTGARLAALIDHERLKLAAACMLLSPYIPMLFMGEEYAEDTPFYYFVSHEDEALIKAVREGRKKEFEAFKWQQEPKDPQDEKTFSDSKLQWAKRGRDRHQLMLRWYTKLIELRKTEAAFRNFNKNDVRASVIGESGLLLERRSVAGDERILVAFNFSEEALAVSLPAPDYTWTKILSSKDQSWSAEPGNKTGLMDPSFNPVEMIQIPPVSVIMYADKKTGSTGE